MEKTYFHCSRCGACCSHLAEFGDLYKELDNGQGVCIFYDSKKSICLQYTDRPLKCRVTEGYVFFQAELSFEEYCRKTKKGCVYLQSLT